jgi:hypothetical protein
LTTERPDSTADIARDTTTEPSPHERPPAHWPTPHSRRIAPQSNAGARAARLPAWNAPPPAAELNDAEEDRGGIQPAIEHAPAAAIVRSGFQLEPGQHVFAHVHGAWHPAVVKSRDRRTVVVDYELDPGPLGVRRQRVTIDRIRVDETST